MSRLFCASKSLLTFYCHRGNHSILIHCLNLTVALRFTVEKIDVQRFLPSLKKKNSIIQCKAGVRVANLAVEFLQQLLFHLGQRPIDAWRCLELNCVLRSRGAFVREEKEGRGTNVPGRTKNEK